MSNRAILSNSGYDRFKQLCQVGLPASGTLYFTISQIFNLPYGVEVVGTVAAVNTFLGLMLGYASRSYENSDVAYQGTINVGEGEEGKTIYSLDMEVPPEDLNALKQARFRVNS